MRTPRLPGGPDPVAVPYEAGLAERALRDLTGIANRLAVDEFPTTAARIDGDVMVLRNVIAALLPTPPAPGGDRHQHRPETCVYSSSHGWNCKPAPGGEEGLRAEVERSDLAAPPPRPSDHVRPLPDLAHRQGDDGGREIVLSDELLDALSGDAKEVGDLGGTHEVMHGGDHRQNATRHLTRGQEPEHTSHMTRTETKARIVLNVVVNTEAWCDEYGVEADEVGKDVQKYIANMVHEHLCELGVTR
jgi:hypothetical protein